MTATGRETERTFKVLVLYTDRTRLNGKFKTSPRTVHVLASNDDEAMLLAAQLVSAIREGGMVVETTVLP